MNNIAAINEENIVEGVLAEFARLAEIPRPSGHEKAVSDYLYSLFTEMGCQVQQDSVNNIIADMPATSDAADKPLTIMQAHMDMVCVADEGVTYDPLKDSIKLVREGNLLHADGTSLGADDGMGIAIIVYIMKNLESHGPLRAIITVDEESGMTGAENLAAEALLDAKYLINCDSEDWDLLTVGSAGSGEIDFHQEFKSMNSQLKHLYTLKLSGLVGGHSGEEINCGSANAIKVMVQCLNDLRKNNVAFDLVSLNGGRAKNVIPSEITAVFYVDETQAKLQEIIDARFAAFKTVYGEVEKQAAFVLTEKTTEDAPVAMEGVQKESLLNLIMCLPNGVSAMSQLSPGLVQSSSNIGVVRTGKNIEVQSMPRSAQENSIKAYYEQAEILAGVLGFEVELGRISPSWAERSDSRLSEIMQAVFAEQNGQKMRVATIHAGLECSWHLQKNRELDIVSIGTNNNDIHSPNETLEIDTIVPQVRLIAETLQRI